MTTITIQIPIVFWFTVQQWMTQNYITDRDYTLVAVQNSMFITFNNLQSYSRFYHAWSHIIYTDNDF